jgi:hypothetical protein
MTVSVILSALIFINKIRTFHLLQAPTSLSNFTWALDRRAAFLCVIVHSDHPQILMLPHFAQALSEINPLTFSFSGDGCLQAGLSATA